MTRLHPQTDKEKDPMFSWLHSEDVIAIRFLHETMHYHYQEIAEMYGVNIKVIEDIGNYVVYQKIRK